MDTVNFKESEDEIIALYNLLKPEDEIEEHEMILAEYYNSPQYKSPLYKFVKHLTDDQRKILNIALTAGCWIYHDIEERKHEYLKDLALQNVEVKNIEQWCSKLKMNKQAATYIKTFINVYLNINMYQ